MADPYSASLVLKGSVAELKINYSRPSYEKNIEEVSDSVRRASSIRRSFNTLSNVISSNSGSWWNPELRVPYRPVFVTFTFRDNRTDIVSANRDFSQFIQRFNYYLYGSKKARLKYVSVIEFQRRGSVHYHSIFFNLRFIPDLASVVARLWGRGFIRLNSVRGVHNVGRYVTKYMTKELSDPRLMGRKSYFRSRGLLRPIVVRDMVSIGALLDLLPDPAYQYKKEHFEYRRYFTGNSPVRLLQLGGYRPISADDDPVADLRRQLNML